MAVRLRHKPTEVDAVLWDGSDAALNDLVALGLTDFWLEDSDTRGVGPKTLMLQTPKGPKSALPGDTVIRGTQGEFYPIEPDIRAGCYHEVA